LAVQDSQILRRLHDLEKEVARIRGTGRKVELQGDLDVQGNRIQGLKRARKGDEPVTGQQFTEKVDNITYVTVLEHDNLAPRHRKLNSGANITLTDQGAKSTIDVAVDDTGLTLDGLNADEFLAMIWFMGNTSA
jgi:hypothetical protein